MCLLMNQIYKKDRGAKWQQKKRINAKQRVKNKKKNIKEQKIKDKINRQKRGGGDAGGVK